MDARALTFFGVARGGLGKGSHCVTSVESDASVQNDVGAVSSAQVCCAVRWTLRNHQKAAEDLSKLYGLFTVCQTHKGICVTDCPPVCCPSAPIFFTHNFAARRHPARI